ncbi:MAG: sugar transferase [Chloroflexi bacterium]|nr:sugar transferase [Chloroflexota bacterium]
MADAVTVNKTSKPEISISEPINEPAYKRPFDLAVLILAHLTLAPLWIVLWIVIPLAIKLDDRGPVFYSQKRLGRNGKIFTVRKFRSMVTDAEKRTGAVWASKNDTRITRVGRILRHTALDELPQVINVWAGDMSLVGPRPERPELHANFAKTTPDFNQRLLVRPGMAGMAQVYGVYDLAPPHKLNFGIAYIGSMGLFLDIKLLTLAVLNTVLGRWGRATGNTTAPTASNIVPFTLPSAERRVTQSANAQAENIEKAA